MTNAPAKTEPQELNVRFQHLANRLKPSNLNRELLVRAAKLKEPGESPFAVDATAGFGEDSLLLAAAGFDVLLLERNPEIASLTTKAIEQALNDPVLSDAASRMRIECCDSIRRLPALEARPDIVLLDPMFPARRKSAAVKKKAQLLQQLESPCEDEVALLEAALAANPRKVIVKRPAKGPYLAGRKPSYSLEGKAIRFDCYVVS